jgi:hypothetical protein
MAAVGHPVSHPRLAAYQLELAYQTYYRDTTWITPLFDAALAHNDLNAAKAANVVDENALQRYLESLDTIKWPEGFEGQVNDLRDNLRKMIEFDQSSKHFAPSARRARWPHPRPSPATQLKNCWRLPRKARIRSAKHIGLNEISRSSSPHSWSCLGGHQLGHRHGVRTRSRRGYVGESAASAPNHFGPSAFQRHEQSTHCIRHVFVGSNQREKVSQPWRGLANLRSLGRHVGQRVNEYCERFTTG